MAGPGRHRANDDRDLLQSILALYDRFARQNETNPRLQGEAAWAYRKVGVLHEQLGHAQEASEAYQRSIRMFEELIKRQPRVAIYRIRLVNTYDLADPWSADSSSLDELCRRFERARSLIDELVAASSTNLDYALARIHIYVKLGVVNHRLGRNDDATFYYRRAILLEGGIIERSPDVHRALCDRAVTQESLALVLLEQGLRSEARKCLDGAAADLARRATDANHPPPRRDHFESLAKMYQRLGEPNRAQEIVASARKR